MNQIARHGKWFSIVCVLGSAVVSSVSTLKWGKVILAAGIKPE